MIPPLPKVPVLYDDEDFLVVAKPGGCAVHRGMCQEGPYLVDLLRAQLNVPPLLVHRLDRGTSGALLVAKYSAAARALSALFAQGDVEKSYVALVRGTAPASALVNHALPNDEGGERVPAETAVFGLESVRCDGSPLRERSYSLVEAQPKTGRFHQVRRHLKHLGHPLIGDTNYGRSEHNRWCRDRFGLSRLALHASRLRLTHPSTGEVIEVHAPLPRDMVDPLLAMGFGRPLLEELHLSPW